MALVDLITVPTDPVVLERLSAVELKLLGFNVITPSMSTVARQLVLDAGGNIFVQAGTYNVLSNADTWQFSQNSIVSFSPKSLISAGANGVTLMRMSSQYVVSSFIRNCKLYNPRTSTVGFTGCTGLHVYDGRNNSGVFGHWHDMGTGAGGIGTLIEHYSYGFRYYDSEILNGGPGSTRLLLRNGVNAVTIQNHIGYSGDHAGPLPDYGIVVFNGLDGSFSFPPGSDLWPTAAVLINGGYSQNTMLYGLLDSGVSTMVNGTYFERNARSDVALGAGSFYFTSIGTHHSLNIGESCFRINGATGANIGPFNPADRSIGQFNAIAGTNCRADGSKIDGDRLTATDGTGIGVVTGLILNLGLGKVRQYSAGTLPIKIREGFSVYRMNVSSGLNITVTGTPYDGQTLCLQVRGSSIASLSFAGVPVDVTGANTAVTKGATFYATYWSSLGTWTLTMPVWNAVP